jgi:hypothetical protein
LTAVDDGDARRQTHGSVADRVIRAALRHVVAATAALGLVSYAYVYTFLIDAPIHSDGVSYYVYLPAWIGDGDPTFETLARDCCGGFTADPIGIHRWPETKRWLAVHPIGVAILMLPFFLVAHALSWWSNLPRDGFSFYYQYVVGAAGLAYATAGLAILRRLLLRHFSEAVVLATLVSIAFGTNLFHYAVYDGTFSHAFSFFLIVCLLLLTDRWWENPEWSTSIGLSAVAALIVLVRHPNAMFLAFVPVYGVRRSSDLASNLHRLWQRRGLVVTMIAMTMCGVAPQLAVYKWATSHWIVKSDPDGHFTFGSPHLFGTLFSVERGVFFWSPVLLFAVAGLWVGRGWARGWVAVTVAVLAADTYLMASWYMWYFGVGYGHRAYVDALGVFGIYMAAFFAWAAERPRVAKAVRALTAALVVLSMVQTVQYWTGVIPGEKTTWDQYRALFLRVR